MHRLPLPRQRAVAQPDVAAVARQVAHGPSVHAHPPRTAFAVAQPGGRLRALATGARAAEPAALLLAAFVHARADWGTAAHDARPLSRIPPERAAVPADEPW